MANDIQVSQKQNDDGTVTINVDMPTELNQLVVAQLASVGLTPGGWLKALLEGLAKDGIDGPAGRFMDQAIVEQGKQCGASDKAIALAKKRLAQCKE